MPPRQLADYDWDIVCTNPLMPDAMIHLSYPGREMFEASAISLSAEQANDLAVVLAALPSLIMAGGLSAAVDVEAQNHESHFGDYGLAWAQCHCTYLLFHHAVTLLAPHFVATHTQWKKRGWPDACFYPLSPLHSAAIYHLTKAVMDTLIPQFTANTSLVSCPPREFAAAADQLLPQLKAVAVDPLTEDLSPFRRLASL
ncbi:MAG: hypothetical protein LBK60_11370 [Verrucomicrobiales bacterium]|jgi:hypothetical protein|nr:hypothetical protein [Verrucomicrobiales bacterium]